MPLGHGQNPDSDLLNPADGGQAVPIQQRLGSVRVHLVPEAQQDAAGDESGVSLCPARRHGSHVRGGRSQVGRPSVARQRESGQNEEDGEGQGNDVAASLHARIPFLAGAMREVGQHRRLDDSSLPVGPCI